MENNGLYRWQLCGMAEIDEVRKMKKNKNEKYSLQPNIDELLLMSAEAKEAGRKFKEKLLQSDVVQALSYWLQEARNNFQDRGTVSNYYGYLKDLILRGMLSHDQLNQYVYVFELNSFYGKLIERINFCEDFELNDRRYRIRALLAFTKFLNEKTESKVHKLSAPPNLMPINDFIPKLADDSLQPQILTKEEFKRLCEKIQRPKQKDANFRDYFVIEIMYQTARPLLDILALQKANIDLTNECILFPGKPNELLSVPITTKLKNGLEVYLQYSQSYRKDETVFITREGNPIFRTHFYQVLKQASEEADLGFTATFKMIQWSLVADRIRKDKSPQKIMKELKLKKTPKKLELG